MMKIFIICVIVATLATPALADPMGGTVVLNEGALFTAPAMENSPFTIRIIGLGDAQNIVEYNVLLNIVAPADSGIHWDEFGTIKGTENIFTGKETFLSPFMVFDDGWTIDIGYGVNDPSDGVTLPNANNILAIASINGGTTFSDWKVEVDPFSYFIDSNGVSYNLTGPDMLIVQPEPTTIMIISVMGVILLKRKKR